MEMGASSAPFPILLPQICYPTVFVIGYGKNDQESLSQRDFTTSIIFLEFYSSTNMQNEVGSTFKDFLPVYYGPRQLHPIVIPHRPWDHPLILTYIF